MEQASSPSSGSLLRFDDTQTFTSLQSFLVIVLGMMWRGPCLQTGFVEMLVVPKNELAPLTGWAGRQCGTLPGQHLLYPDNGMTHGSCDSLVTSLA